MLFLTHVPGPPLSGFVAWFWFYEGLTPDHPLERVLPDGSMELIINLRNEARHVFDPHNHRPLRSYRDGWLSGAHSKFIVIDTAAEGSMIGVHFQPGGAAAFLGLPLGEVRNSVVDLEALWSRTARELREQLLEAPSPAAKFQILETALRARWRGPACRHPAVRHALDCFLREPHLVAVGNVAAEAGLSPRRFIELFTAQVGLTPKVFCRVRRFQRVLGEVQRRRPVAWADVAVACGYYDQPHFIHDFQEFCGESPGEFLTERMEYPNFVPIRS